MHDCENEVIDRVSTAVLAEFPGIDIASEYIERPAKFPHLSIYMSNNPIYRTRQSNSDHEDFSSPVFDINIYSNKSEGKKAECKAIAAVVDEAFFRMNFNRVALQPVQNKGDASIYRIVGRFRAVTDGKYFYRR